MCKPKHFGMWNDTFNDHTVSWLLMVSYCLKLVFSEYLWVRTIFSLMLSFHSYWVSVCIVCICLSYLTSFFPIKYTSSLCLKTFYYSYKEHTLVCDFCYFYITFTEIGHEPFLHPSAFLEFKSEFLGIPSYCPLCSIFS